MLKEITIQNSGRSLDRGKRVHSPNLVSILDDDPLG